MSWVIQHLAVVTVLIVLFAIGLVVLIFVGLHRLYRHEPTRPQFGSALVSLVIAVLFSVVLNNLYALKRDSDNRARALRDQHYAQLKPVLRAEAANLGEIASEMKKQAHITGVNNYEVITTDTAAMLWPDVMSRDLERHFPAYDLSKRGLLEEISHQDQEFRGAMQVARTEIKPMPGLNTYWKEIAAMAFIERCLGRGPGLRLNVNQNGFSFEYWGASVGASGGAIPPRPDAGQVAASRGYQSLRNAGALRTYCENLRQGARDIAERANALAERAKLLSQETVLPGKCEFLTTADPAQ